jgi:hypothetical protein
VFHSGPAPWATTQQATAPLGDCRSPETVWLSLTMIFKILPRVISCLRTLDARSCDYDEQLSPQMASYVFKALILKHRQSNMDGRWRHEKLAGTTSRSTSTESCSCFVHVCRLAWAHVRRPSPAPELSRSRRRDARGDRRSLVLRAALRRAVLNFVEI